MYFFLTLNKIENIILKENVLNDKQKLTELSFHFIEKNLSLNVSPWIDHLFLFYFLFLIGITGIIFNYKNYLITMFCIELMYLGITFCFILIAFSTMDPKGQIYGLFLLVIAAAESAIGLGILIVLYRFGNSIDFEKYQELKG
jgi:NADH:ubiquinone oxidoreductase subunit K